MTATITVDEAMTRRWDRSGGNFRTQFIGQDRHQGGERPDPGRPSPIAYLVEQAPHRALRAHFHEADQFQIFVAGEGRIGAKRAVPGKGHFVGPFSGYGPIVGDDRGIAYMTLRNAFDPGAQFLPENIERIRPHRFSRREVLFDVPAPVDDTTPDALCVDAVTTLVAPQADGLAATSVRLSPRAVATGPDPADGGGQYWLVMAGSMVEPGTGVAMKRLSMAFVAPDDRAYVAEAGPDGLHVLLLQFPRFRAAASH